MISQKLRMIIFTAVLILLPTVFAAAQELNQTNVIKITLLKVKPKLDGEGKFIGIESEDALQTVTLKLEAAVNDKTELFGFLKQQLKAEDYYKLQIVNGLPQGWFIYIHNFSADKSCTTILPNKREVSLIARDNSKTVSSFFTPKQQKILPEGKVAIFNAKGGEELFAIFASQDISFDLALMKLSAGVSMGRGEPIFIRSPFKTDVLQGSSGGRGDIYQGVSKGKTGAELSGRFTVTANLGNVHNSNGEELRSIEYYDAIY